MFRHLLLTTSALAIGFGPLAAQTKSPASLPHELDVKTTPLAPPEDSLPASRFTPPAPSASDRARVAEAAAREPLPFPLYDVDESGAVWVRGATYKAKFGDGAATYVPFLGSRAPRNFPVEMRVRSVTSGGAEIAFDARAAATRDGALVSIDRGSFVEEYAIDATSVEQRFVFSSLPSRGDVVVSIDVTSELEGRSDDQGFRFEGPLGHVRYGRAFALDARGARVPIESRLAEGRIELTVPASFVATAELPLVIDPHTGTIAVDTDAGDDWQADVAYDASTNRFAVVYENVYSATDHDVYVRAYVDQIFVDSATIDFTTDDWRNPKVANNNVSNQFLCVAQVGAAGSRIIRGRELTASTLAAGSQFTISGSEGGDKYNPDVGGDPAVVAPTYYCVVWQRDLTTTDTDVHARLVRADATLLGTSTIFLENSAATLDSVPSVSKTDGLPPFATQNWTVVWQHETTSTNDDVQGARILWNGTITESTFFVASTSENETSPTASEPLNDSPAGRPWLASYRIGSDLRLRVFEDNAVQATTDIAGPPFGSLGQPALTTDGRKWMFAYTSFNGLFPSTDTDLFAGSLNFIAGALSFAEVPVALANDSTLDETRPEIASTYSSAVTGPWRSYVTYDVYNGADYDVLFAVYDTPVNAGGFLFCGGTDATCPCGNGNDGSLGNAGCANSVHASGARLDVGGTWYVSGDSAVLYAQGMPNVATCLFFQGTTPITNGSSFGDGLRCVSGTVIRLGTKTASGGSAQYGYGTDTTIHTKGLVPGGGGWRYYQSWYRNAAAFCTSSTFNLSNGAAMLWAP